MISRSLIRFVGVAALLLCAGPPFMTRGGEPVDEPLLTVPRKVGGRFELSLVNLQGHVVGKVLESDQPLLEPAWSPDGTRLAYITVDGGQPQIFVCRSDGTAAVNLTKSSFLERNPAWSPDGSEIVWTRFEDDQHTIWTMKSDGSDGKRISDPAVMCSNPSWSPDRKRIAFGTHRPGDLNFRVWQMNADGAEPRELFKEMVIRTVYPAWSPDGKQILFGGAGSDGRVQLCICNSTGDGFAQLTHDAKLCSYAAWSPDGQYIAYVAFERWPGGYSPWEADADTDCPPGDLMLCDTLSGEHRKLLSGELPMYGPRPSWKPSSEKKRNYEPVGAK